MDDYVLKAPSRDAFLSAATSLGYADAQNLIEAGPTSLGGSYFINVIGEIFVPTGEQVEGLYGPYSLMAAIDGYWVRIRINNGGVLPDVPVGLELFPPVKYLADGVTLDPAYTQPNYGMIA